MAEFPFPPPWVQAALRHGLAIPAHPLALTNERRFDPRRQQALTRYYHAAGAGGIAVGVHTTQFAIRAPAHGLLRPVLELAALTIASCDAAVNRQTVRIAGVCGTTRQATGEAELARELGYHAGLLSLAALHDADDTARIEHCRQVARAIPLFGFYLQTAVGGPPLSLDFWRRFVEIPNVVAIKIAPFHRYQTLEVLRAVVESGREGEIALYTGNDDNIVFDLLGEYATPRGRVHIAGGLLGHWACWTRRAVDLLEQVQAVRAQGRSPAELLSLALPITDCNAAFFDAAHQFAGCIAGIHEVLRRQGLLANTFCLDPAEQLSPGQAAEIDRVYQAYPPLNDDAFVAEHLSRWLSG